LKEKQKWDPDVMVYNGKKYKLGPAILDRAYRVLGDAKHILGDSKNVLGDSKAILGNSRHILQDRPS
jgi:hypothetical protein